MKLNPKYYLFSSIPPIVVFSFQSNKMIKVFFISCIYSSSFHISQIKFKIKQNEQNQDIYEHEFFVVDEETLLIIVGQLSEDGFGNSLSLAGDVNNDVYDSQKQK